MRNLPVHNIEAARGGVVVTMAIALAASAIPPSGRSARARKPVRPSPSDRPATRRRGSSSARSTGR